MLFQQLQQVHHLSDQEMRDIRAIFAHSAVSGQGNPTISQHPFTPAQCAAKLKEQGVSYENAQFEQICGGKYMAPLYDPKTGTRGTGQSLHRSVRVSRHSVRVSGRLGQGARSRARSARPRASGCAMRMNGRARARGACNRPITDSTSPGTSRRRPPSIKCASRTISRTRPTRRWSYGPEYQRGICATGSFKTPGCPGGGWQLCGSNTYPPAIFRPATVRLDVYDLNGNAAEHMNLPLNEQQMSSLGSKELGYTEMKGSWFIFDTYRAHEDWCRWRAPFWHGTRVMDPAESCELSSRLSLLQDDRTVPQKSLSTVGDSGHEGGQTLRLAGALPSPDGETSDSSARMASAKSAAASSTVSEVSLVARKARIERHRIGDDHRVRPIGLEQALRLGGEGRMGRRHVDADGARATAGVDRSKHRRPRADQIIDHDNVSSGHVAGKQAAADAAGASYLVHERESDGAGGWPLQGDPERDVRV